MPTLEKNIEFCVSGSRPQSIAETAMPAGVCVWMTQATSWRAAVDRAVDDEAGVVDAVAGARVLHDRCRRSRSSPGSRR
mgnify:CR=1 FL=1